MDEVVGWQGLWVVCGLVRVTWVESEVWVMMGDGTIWKSGIGLFFRTSRNL